MTKSIPTLGSGLKENSADPWIGETKNLPGRRLPLEGQVHLCNTHKQLMSAKIIYNSYMQTGFTIKMIKLLMATGWHGHADQVLPLFAKRKGGCTAWVVDRQWSTSGSTWGHVAALQECENLESASTQHTTEISSVHPKVIV